MFQILDYYMQIVQPMKEFEESKFSHWEKMSKVTVTATLKKSLLKLAPYDKSKGKLRNSTSKLYHIMSWFLF